MRVAATNQLSALEAHWPGAKAVFADVESPVNLEFLTRYPTPAAARHLGEKRMAAFLVKHGYSGRRPASQLLDRLRQAPPGSTGEVLTEALRDAVLALVTVLRALNGAVKDLDRSAAAHLGEHPDGPIFTSLPRSGQINAAQMLAERGDCRQAYAGPDSVAALAGVSPVTRQSGKHRSVSFRWACNKRFRRAITTFADNSRHARPWAARLAPRERSMVLVDAQTRAEAEPVPVDGATGRRVDGPDFVFTAGPAASRPFQDRYAAHPKPPES